MNKRKAIIGGGLAILILAAIAWGFGFIGGDDPAIAKLQDLRKQMDDKNLTDADRTQLRGQFRQQIESLTDRQRQAFFDSNRTEWMARSQQRMNEFFAMSKADQQKRLDQILDQIAKAQANPQNNSPRANGGNAGGRGRNLTDAQREERAKRRLDRTSPTQRAQFAQFRQMLNDRAQQRGINLGNGRGGGFGWRGGA